MSLANPYIVNNAKYHLEEKSRKHNKYLNFHDYEFFLTYPNFVRFVGDSISGGFKRDANYNMLAHYFGLTSSTLKGLLNNVLHSDHEELHPIVKSVLQNNVYVNILPKSKKVKNHLQGMDGFYSVFEISKPEQVYSKADKNELIRSRNALLMNLNSAKTIAENDEFDEYINKEVNFNIEDIQPKTAEFERLKLLHDTNSLLILDVDIGYISRYPTYSGSGGVIAPKKKFHISTTPKLYLNKVGEENKKKFIRRDEMLKRLNSLEECICNNDYTVAGYRGDDVSLSYIPHKSFYSSLKKVKSVLKSRNTSFSFTNKIRSVKSSDTDYYKISTKFIKTTNTRRTYYNRGYKRESVVEENIGPTVERYLKSFKPKTTKGLSLKANGFPICLSTAREKNEHWTSVSKVLNDYDDPQEVIELLDQRDGLDFLSKEYEDIQPYTSSLGYMLYYIYDFSFIVSTKDIKILNKFKLMNIPITSIKVDINCLDDIIEIFND